MWLIVISPWLWLTHTDLHWLTMTHLHWLTLTHLHWLTHTDLHWLTHTHICHCPADVMLRSQVVFSDVHEDFSDVRRILSRFEVWRGSYTESYNTAYIPQCLPKLLNPIIRHQLLGWNPLQVNRTVQRIRVRCWMFDRVMMCVCIRILAVSWKTCSGSQQWRRSVMDTAMNNWRT